MKSFIVSVAALALLAVAAAPVLAGEPSVSRAQFTTSVLDREPVDNLTVIQTTTENVFFFTEFRNMEGTQATHRWIYGDEVRFELSFKIRGPRWRVYSQKTLPKEWTGDWKVEIVGEDGAVIESYDLKHAGS